MASASATAHPFLNLPLELRTAIYKLALQPQTLTFSAPTYSPHSPNLRWKFWKKPYHTIKTRYSETNPMRPRHSIPALLQVCSRIRSDILSLGFYQLFHSNTGTELPLGYFNPDLDRLDFSYPVLPSCPSPDCPGHPRSDRQGWNCAGYPQEHQLWWFERKVCDEDRGKVKRVTVPLELLERPISSLDVAGLFTGFDELEMLGLGIARTMRMNGMEYRELWMGLWSACNEKMPEEGRVWDKPKMLSDRYEMRLVFENGRWIEQISISN